jgi:hypothetical protein
MSKQHILYLDVPFEDRKIASYLGARYDKNKKTWYATSDAKGYQELSEKYGSTDYSMQRWLEDDENGVIKPAVMGNNVYKPKPHQVLAGKRILSSWKQSYQGFLIADGTGTGKTLSSLYGTSLIANAMGRNPVKRLNVLIVCPKAVIPSWRQTLRSYPQSIVLRPLIINYQSLNKLIAAPASASSAKTRRTKNRRIARSGRSKIAFDVIIFDEEQYLKNYNKSAVSLAAATISDIHSSYRKGKSPFVISSTATPGTNPLELAMMSPWLSRLLDDTNTQYIPPEKWGTYLQQHHFSIRGKGMDVSWRGDEHALKNDVHTIAKALERKDAPYIMRNPSDLAGWPEQQIIAIPVDIGTVGMMQYRLAWNEFRGEMLLAKKNGDTKSPLVAALRFRQKSSILKAKSISEFAIENVKAGKQVFIGCEFMDTIEILGREFEKARIPCVEYSGRNEKEREQCKLDFQHGKAKIILCTVVAGQSFQSGEILSDGTKATGAERITIIADVRNRVIDTSQQMGRCHRDGQNSICYFPYADGTIDIKVINTFINKISNMDIMLTNYKGSDYLDSIMEGINK